MLLDLRKARHRPSIHGLCLGTPWLMTTLVVFAPYALTFPYKQPDFEEPEQGEEETDQNGFVAMKDDSGSGAAPMDEGEEAWEGSGDSPKATERKRGRVVEEEEEEGDEAVKRRKTEEEGGGEGDGETAAATTQEEDDEGPKSPPTSPADAGGESRW